MEEEIKDLLQINYSPVERPKSSRKNTPAPRLGLYPYGLSGRSPLFSKLVELEACSALEMRKVEYVSNILEESSIKRR